MGVILGTQQVLERRKCETKEKLLAFRESLLRHIPENEREELCGDHTCIYAVGSAGRMEMSAHSDLDLFLVRTPKKAACRIDEVRLQSAIVRVHRELGLEEPSNDAIFLKMHTSADFVERLGEPRDDTENTFTARMLLLLESTPIVGEDVYDEVVRQAIAAYWTNLQSHRDDYLPFCLTNDIVRYWRNLLLNYEHKTARKLRELENGRDKLEQEEYHTRQQQLDADKWLRSCKLRFTRCITCYATVAWLLSEAARTNNITGDSFHEATKLTPMERLRLAASMSNEETLYVDLAKRYTSYLDATDKPKAELLTLFSSKEFRRPMMAAAEAFGDGLFELLKKLGGDQRLYRYVVI